MLVNVEIKFITVLFFVNVEIHAFQFCSVLCYIGTVEEQLRKSQNRGRFAFPKQFGVRNGY